MKIIVAAFCISFSLFFSVHGQGSSQNLDFEAATISQNQTPGLVNVSDALPNWDVFYNLAIQPQIGFNTVTLGVQQVVLLGDGSSIEGGFSVYLQGGISSVPSDVDIQQDILIPDNTQSILFKAQPGTDSLFLTLHNQFVPFVALATTSNYTLFGGNISSFAGQSVMLKFAAWASSSGIGWNLDSIEFSSQPIPEPSTWALLIAGSGLLFASFIFQPP
jgi:PEP-CTERM motif